MTACWPQIFESCSVTTRATMSVCPPAANGTMKRTTRLGQSSDWVCAHAARPLRLSASADPPDRAIRRRRVSTTTSWLHLFYPSREHLRIAADGNVPISKRFRFVPAVSPIFGSGAKDAIPIPLTPPHPLHRRTAARGPGGVLADGLLPVVQRCLHPRHRHGPALLGAARQRADTDRDGNHDHAEHEHPSATGQRPSPRRPYRLANVFQSALAQ